jgi:phospholipid/cholesterol/gamma-HCH transport system permease protein
MADRIAGMETKAAMVELPDEATLACRGAWNVHTIAMLQRQLAALDLPGDTPVTIDGRDIDALDTAGAWLINKIRQRFETAGRRVRLKAFRPAHGTLVRLLEEVRDVTPGERAGHPWHRRWLMTGYHLVDFLAFIGESVVTLLRALVNPVRVRWKVLIAEIYDAGYKAMPIVGLLSFLMGVVIAYQGAVQLKLYGANIYVADLVGYSMLRELAPLLTAILVAGRTGSAYTAQIGTMQVTEEVAAMQTIGIPPMDMLVLPKLLALVVVMPLLTVFADILSLCGGMLMADLQLGIGYHAFLIRLGAALKYSTFMIGIGKAPVFAAIIAIVGCYQGFRVRRSAESVGRHTTISVVQSIFLVIVTDALFSILFSMLGV